MSCPTCDHTLNGIATGVYWCPRCGTLKDFGAFFTISLVERCKQFEKTLLEMPNDPYIQPDLRELWKQLGIKESINI